MSHEPQTAVIDLMISLLSTTLGVQTSVLSPGSEELTDIDMCGTDNEGRWHDMEPTPFIAVIKAESEEEACKKAATQMRYDPRCLFAIKVSE